MKLFRLLLTICVLAGAIAPAEDAPAAGPEPGSPGRAMNQDSCRVLKDGDTVFIRCAFSTNQDLVQLVGKGANNQVSFIKNMLVPAASNDIRSTGQVIHWISDDCTPWHINYTYIGANHGCSDPRLITSPGHGLTEADLGSEWKDAVGARFYPIKVPDGDNIWFLGENTGKNAIWQFARWIKGSALTNSATGRAINIVSNRLVYLNPCCRFSNQEYLADGKTPLRENAETACKFLDIVEQYEIINAGSVLDQVRKNPGRQISFTNSALEGVIRYQLVYRFLPNGVVVGFHKAKALQTFVLGYMGFIQSTPFGDVYYVPKSKPFVQDGKSFDFKMLQDFKPALSNPVIFQAETDSVADPQNLPDRFIQLKGERENGQFVPRLGYAMGYSPVSGITRIGERQRYTSKAGTIYTSRKSYPCALDKKFGSTVPAGTEFECVTYRVYFDPQKYPGATCVYWYREDAGYIVYLDYHRAVTEAAVVLPAEMSGKSITVLEKTPSLTLKPEGKVLPEGLRVSVTNGYGYAVLLVAAGK